MEENSNSDTFFSTLFKACLRPDQMIDIERFCCLWRAYRIEFGDTETEAEEEVKAMRGLAEQYNKAERKLKEVYAIKDPMKRYEQLKNLHIDILGETPEEAEKNLTRVRQFAEEYKDACRILKEFKNNQEIHSSFSSTANKDTAAFDKEIDDDFSQAQESLKRTYGENIPQHEQERLDEMKRIGKELKESQRVIHMFKEKPEMLNFHLNMRKTENMN